VSTPRPRTKAESKAIIAAAEAVDRALELLRVASGLGTSNPPCVEVSMLLVASAASHTKLWREAAAGE